MRTSVIVCATKYATGWPDKADNGVRVQHMPLADALSQAWPTDAHVATYAILLQCTGVALWFYPRGPLKLEQVAELHIELVLGSLQASPGLIGEAIESVSRHPAAAAGDGR